MLAGTEVFYFVHANPYQFVMMEEVAPNIGTKPPTISVLSPKNETIYAPKQVLFSFDSSVNYSGDARALFFYKIYYKSDWQSGFTSLYEYVPETGMSTTSEFNSTVFLTEIPEGNHTITIYATEKGRYEEPDVGSGGFVTLYYPFEITGSSSINFIIDATSPKVSILSLENKTYSTSTLALNYNVNEPISKVTYSIDGKNNETLNGNIILPELSNGLHNVTVYAWDVAGNVGSSETAYFSVKVPVSFPVVPVAAVSTASVVVVCIGIFLYLRRNKR
jgi:hypothetical protein